MQIGYKTCNFEALYRSTSQSQDDLEFFADYFEITLGILAQKKTFLKTDIAEFNGKSKNRYNKDKKSCKVNTIESITSQFGLNQLINEPTHILQNSSSYIDLIFKSHF